MHNPEDMEVMWNPLTICADEQLDVELESEEQYWNTYDTVMDTIVAVSEYYTERDPNFIHQCIVKLPIEFGEFEDE